MPNTRHAQAFVLLLLVTFAGESGCKKKAVAVPLPNTPPPAITTPATTAPVITTHPETPAPSPAAPVTTAPVAPPVTTTVQQPPPEEPAPVKPPVNRPSRPQVTPPVTTPPVTSPPVTPPAGAPVLGEVLTPDQQRQLNAAIDQSLGRAQNNLNSLANRQLAQDDQRVVAQVQNFIQQAQSRRKSDLTAAKSLADRADLLASDLLRRLK